MTDPAPKVSMRTLTTAAFPVGDGLTTGDGEFLQGVHVTVIATPNLDTHFTHWAYINGLEASKDQSFTFVITADTTITAHFAAGADPNAGLLKVLHECDATGVYIREVWVNPNHVVYAIRHADVSHLKMTDGTTVFVTELPRDISLTLLADGSPEPQGGDK